MSDDKSLSIEVVKNLLAEQQKQNAEMLKTVIQELKKPTLLEQQALDRQAAEVIARQEERKGNAAGILMKMKQERFEKETCTHEHSNGTSHGVKVHEANGPGYIHCQLCHANVRPGPKPEANADPRAVYNTELFNKMFQKLPSNELFM